MIICAHYYQQMDLAMLNAWLQRRREKERLHWKQSLATWPITLSWYSRVLTLWYNISSWLCISHLSYYVGSFHYGKSNIVNVVSMNFICKWRVNRGSISGKANNRKKKKKKIDNLVNRNMKVKNEEGGGSRKEGSWRGCQNFNYSFHICYRTTSWEDGKAANEWYWKHAW